MNDTVTTWQVFDPTTHILRDCTEAELHVLAQQVEESQHLATITPPAPAPDPEEGLTFFVQPDGHGTPTLWSHYQDEEDPEDPRVVLRLSELPHSARPYWSRIIAAFNAIEED